MIKKNLSELEYVFVAGMQRSGSTWLYNAMRLILQLEAVDFQCGYRGEGDQLRSYLQATAQRATVQLIKCHDFVDEAAALVRDGKAAVLYSKRDLRDVLASLSKFHDLPPERILDSGALQKLVSNSKEWRTLPGVICLEYGTIRNFPDKGVLIILEKFGITADIATSKRLADELSVDNLRAKASVATSSHSGFTFDDKTLLHRYHIQSGEIGRYKDELSVGVIAAVEAEFSDYLTVEGYRPRREIENGPMISYAQNFEDVMLNRVFGQRRQGVYIDVGAANPAFLSVTKHFYDRGWAGISVEPSIEQYSMIQEQRPRDINICGAAGSAAGVTALYELSGFEECSSLYKKYAENARTVLGGSLEVVRQDTEVVTLRDLCERFGLDDIDFLKIDVEGAEREVLLGADFEGYRPKVVLIESMEPLAVFDCAAPEINSTHSLWEEILLNHDYMFLHFDGLNRFYIRKESADLARHFKLPIWLHDNFRFPEPVAIDLDNLEARNSLFRQYAEQVVAIRTQKATFDEAAQHHSTEIEEFGRRIARLEDKRSRDQQELSSLVEQLRRLRTSKAEVDEEANHLKKELRETWEALQALVQRTNETEEALKQVKETLSLARIDLAERERESVDAQTTAKELIQEIAQLNEDKAALEENNRRAEAKVGELTAVIGALRKDVAESRGERDALTGENELLKADAERLRHAAFMFLNEICTPRLPLSIFRTLRQRQRKWLQYLCDVSALEWSSYDRPPLPIGAGGPSAHPGNLEYGSWHSLKQKIDKRKDLTVVFVNDNGFLYGAGIALKRQVESFLLRGHRVAVVSWAKGNVGDTNWSAFSGAFLGNIVLSDSYAGAWRGAKTHAAVQGILSFRPDLIITGNFHAANLPAEIIQSIHRLQVPVIVYTHDIDWATGGCAYPDWYECEHHLTECDDSRCPKPMSRYPFHSKGDIAKNWKQRRALFSGHDPVAMATNSAWATSVFERAYPDNRLIGTVYLTLDEELYKKSDPKQCRLALGLPENDFIILLGACSLDDPRKGGQYSLNVIEHYASVRGVHICVFGNADVVRPPANLTQFGYVSSESKMVSIYSASDVFVNPAYIESFGQTMLEASACELPLVTFAVCGIPDISREGINALHAELGSVEGIIDAIENLRNSPALATRLGRGGRRLVEMSFACALGYFNWESYLERVCNSKLEQELVASWRFKSALGINQSYDKTHQLAGGIRVRGLFKADQEELPLITIAVVVFNDKDALHKTLLSIFGQDYPNMELIVVDGGSTDGTVDLLNAYDDVIDFWVSEGDDGIYDAMNKAASLAKGRWVNYMNADDQFAARDSVSDLFSELKGDSDVIFGEAFYKQPNGPEEVLPAYDFNVKYDRLLAGDFEGDPWLKGLPAHQSTFIKADLIRKHKFDTSIKISADWDLMVRLKEAGATFQAISKIVSVYRAGGFSAERPELWIRDVWDIALKYSSSGAAVDRYFKPIFDSYVARAADAD